MDTDAIALEMQNMESNDLSEALLDGFGDTHAFGTPDNPVADADMDEFGLDSGEGYQPPTPEELGLDPEESKLQEVPNSKPRARCSREIANACWYCRSESEWFPVALMTSPLTVCIKGFQRRSPV